MRVTEPSECHGNVGPGRLGCVVAGESRPPLPVDRYREAASAVELSHLTVEIRPIPVA